MTDLDATTSGTRTCPSCGAQNDASAATCHRCGTPLAGAASPDAQREDLELEEVWRAAGAEGYDTDFTPVESGVRCTRCTTVVALGDDMDHWWQARDTATDRDDVVVVAVRCPACATPGRAALEGATFRSLVDADPDVAVGDPTEVAWHRGPPAGSTPDRPLGADRRFFDETGPGRLAEQGSLRDAEGEDIRQYTGEPVETDEGWVLPRQQNVGPGNEAGGGEWPDPRTPPASTGHEPDR